ncbi:MAG: MogA/MoaB family molybdenum cofactor biosynthesis protein [Thermoprotei archaeon]
MSAKKHEEKAARAFPKLRFVIVTVSSSRYQNKSRGEPYKDESGDVAQSEITSKGHDVVWRTLVSDDVLQIRYAVLKSLVEKDCDVCVTLGGTGISPRDVTIEALSAIIEKQLPGFGELFRAESIKEIGPPALLTRAIAGVTSGRLIVALPGSPDAALYGIRLLIIQAAHIISIARQ